MGWNPGKVEISFCVRNEAAMLFYVMPIITPKFRIFWKYITLHSFALLPYFQLALWLTSLFEGRIRNMNCRKLKFTALGVDNSTITFIQNFIQIRPSVFKLNYEDWRTDKRAWWTLCAFVLMHIVKRASLPGLRIVKCILSLCIRKDASERKWDVSSNCGTGTSRVSPLFLTSERAQVNIKGNI
jgi:hypothetical protein